MELPAKQHCRLGQFCPIVLGAEYLSYVKSIETHGSAFLTLNILCELFLLSRTGKLMVANLDSFINFNQFLVLQQSVKATVLFFTPIYLKNGIKQIGVF